MQYVFFDKCIRSVHGVWGKAPEAGEFLRIFVLKVTLQCVRLLLTVRHRKNGEQDILVAPPALPVPAPMHYFRYCICKVFLKLEGKILTMNTELVLMSRSKSGVFNTDIESLIVQPDV